MTKIVKNISEQTLSIPNVGRVEAGKQIEVPDDFNNPNFENVSRETKPEETSEDGAEEKGNKKGSKSHK